MIEGLRRDEPCYALMEGRAANMDGKPPRRVQQLQVQRDGELKWFVRDMGLEVEWPTAHPAFTIMCGGIEVAQAIELAEQMRYDERWAALDRELKAENAEEFPRLYQEGSHEALMQAKRQSSFGPLFRKQRD